MSAAPENIPAEQDDTGDDEAKVIRIVDTPKTRKAIKAAIINIRNLKNMRKGINEEITAELSALTSNYGISRQAAKEALARFELNDDKRLERDRSYALCLKALDIGFQPGLFDVAADGESTS